MQVAALSWWSAVSPFDPGGSTVAIVFIVAVGMIKDGADDYKRHVEDRALNQLSFATRLRRRSNASADSDDASALAPSTPRASCSASRASWARTSPWRTGRA